MSTFEDRLAGALREYAADQEPAGARRTPRRGLFVLVPVVAAVAAVLLLLVPGGREPAPASAAEFLRSAAATAEGEKPPAAGRYLYVRREFRSTLALAPVKAGTEETWTRADGSGRTLVRDGSGRVVEDARRRAGFVVGSERVPRLADPRGLLERQARRTIAENPGFDPAQLRAFTAYTILRDVLAAPASAELRAEAFRALAATPGLRRAGDTVIARVGDVELRLTVQDGHVAALERRLLRRSSQLPGPPRVVDRSVIVERATVNSTRARG